MKTANTTPMAAHAPLIMMTVKEAAQYLGLAVSTLNKWRCPGYGTGPVFIRLGRAIRYERSDLERFADARRMATTAGR